MKFIQFIFLDHIAIAYDFDNVTSSIRTSFISIRIIELMREKNEKNQVLEDERIVQQLDSLAKKSCDNCDYRF